MDRLPIALVAVVSSLASVPALAAEPPAPTLAQLEKGLGRSDPGTVGRPMSATTHLVVAKPSGADREEMLTEKIRRADGTTETRIIRATKGGKDITAEKRAEEAKRAAAAPAGMVMDPAEPGRRKEGSSLGLKIPTGTDRKLFVFGEPTPEGKLLVASYEPAKGAKGDDLSRGKLAWDSSSGEPVWLDAQLVDPPTGVQELRIHAELGGAGDAIYTHVLRTSGVAGVLWIKRRFEITVEMNPAAP